MKTHTFLALICLSLFTPTLFGQTNAPADSANVVTPPPIPEEARKHFVMGTTLFKDAKTPDDYSQVESEFKQAADLAPQWPDARYNLALAKEAAGDYSSALTDLKLYQEFKLSDDEARTVQDKIYSIEAKKNKRHDMLYSLQGIKEHDWAWEFKGSSKRGWANNVSGTATTEIDYDKNTVRFVFDFPAPGGGTCLYVLGGIAKGDDYASIEWRAMNQEVVKVTIDQAASQIHCENVACRDYQSHDYAYITFDLKK